MWTFYDTQILLVCLLHALLFNKIHRALYTLEVDRSHPRVLLCLHIPLHRFGKDVAVFQNTGNTHEMDPPNCEIASSLVASTYVTQGAQALQRRRKVVKSLLSCRKLPDSGWDDDMIRMFLRDISLMDSNNFMDNVGLGEREGRVAYHGVRERHYGMSHGMGRSGELSAEQPKAAGSSILAKITNHLVKDACCVAGFEDIGKVLVIPVATGMSLVLAMLGIRSMRPMAKYVIWSRIDQKTCIKSILAAGYIPIVVQLRLQGNALVSDVDAIRHAADNVGWEHVACVLTTTSCFAPRCPDDVVQVAKFCASAGIPHVVNNAYGVQSQTVCQLLTSAWRRGRVDVIVQSTDKNFMVPVGGSFMMSHKNQSDLLDRVNSLYPGRASLSPTIDVLMTLLHWGKSGWIEQLQKRHDTQEYLVKRLYDVCDTLSEIPIVAPSNDISFGMTLNSFGDHASFLGSMLFQRCASGARVLTRKKPVAIGGIEFQNFGQSHDAYPHTYMTVAAALGTSKHEVDEFFTRLLSCATQCRKKMSNEIS